jgi:tryptophan halogenase
MNFIEYPEITLNSAIPFQLKLSDFSNENFVTTAWAQKNGWMWMIPKQDSIGCGYIYDNNYIDEQGAQKEIEEKLGIPISVNRKINFRAGRLKNFWNKNVLSVGLASSFLEPLEATSIHGTIAQLSNFIFYYLKENIQDTMNSECIKEYNFQTGKLIDNFKIFILLHYVNAREDTDFWKNMNKSAMKNKEIKKIVNIAKTRLLNDFDTESKNIFGPVDSSLLNVALVAYNIFTKDAAKKESLLLLNKEEAIDHENWLCDYIENNNWISNKDFLSIISNH